jgi:hypothetical protein
MTLRNFIVNLNRDIDVSVFVWQASLKVKSESNKVCA